ncbi:MAG: BLUF domain-containing protein [Duganella sp.]
MLVRLLYASFAATDTPVGGVTAIMQQAHAWNPKHGITGVLCHSDRLYLQVLEGGRDQVNALYAKILRDPRHTDVVLLHYEEISERCYSGWTMGQVNLNKLNPGTLLRYSALPEFSPHTLPGKSSLALIDELLAAASVLGRA